MKIQVIRKLCEATSIEDLKKAESALLEEQKPSIDIPGDDEGEQLTHVMAAIWVKEEMKGSNCDVITAIRNYSQKVRKSIS